MGVLPFLTEGALQETDGTAVATVGCSVWSAVGFNTDVGRAFDHEAQAPVAFYDALRVQNRVLVIEGIRYRVVSATRHDYLPHVALRLREMRPGGGG